MTVEIRCEFSQNAGGHAKGPSRMTPGSIMDDYEAESQLAGVPTQDVTLLQPLANELPMSVFLIATQKTKATKTTIKVYSTKP